MEIVLLSNLLEHRAVDQLIQKISDQITDPHFLVCGDLLNVFPEPGEDLEGSIFHEIYGGDLIFSEMNRLVKKGFKGVAESSFIEPLSQMFFPTGKNYQKASKIAQSRYERLFFRLSEVLGNHPFYSIPGNMDYPAQAILASSGFPQIRMIDFSVTDFSGVRFGALGGIPNTSHPFRGVAEISPYEMSEPEYERRLQLLKGVDVLVTHLSPEEFPPLRDFLNQTPLQLLICRAPFDFRKEADFRGKAEVQRIESKRVVKVRPFDFPLNQTLVLSLDHPQVSQCEIRQVPVHMDG